MCSSFFAQALKAASLLVTATMISLLTVTTTATAISAASAQDLDVVASKSPQKYKFALIGKSIDNTFFKEVNLGCQEYAQEVSTAASSNKIQPYQNVQVECIFLAPNVTSEGDESTNLQIEILNDIIQNKSQWDGISIAVNDADKMTPIINQTVLEHNIPVITFDSDAPNSERIKTIGTDNFVFGEQLGKVLIQLSPIGGRYSIIYTTPALNLKERVDGIRSTLDDYGSNWEFNQLYDGQGSNQIFLQKMYQSMKDFPDQEAIISVGGWPMYNETGWTEFVEEYPDLLTVCGDASILQITIAKRFKVNGLVGQMPYQMGAFSVGKFS